MAVPTISGVSPATGSAEGGVLLEITGTNFNTWPAPEAMPDEDVAPGAAILVGGQAPEWVEVRSTTSIVCRLGPYVGVVRGGVPAAGLDQFSAVNVVVQNLNAAGAIVVGEAATRVAAFTWQRRDLGPSAAQDRGRGVYKRVQDAVMETLRRRVCREVAIGRSSEYAEGTATEVKVATLPALGLVFRWEDDPDYAEYAAGFEEVENPADANEIWMYRGLRSRRLRVTVLMAARTSWELSGLQELLEDAVLDTGQISMAAQAALFPGLSDSYNWHFSETPTIQNNNPDLDKVAGRAVILVRGVLVMGEHPAEEAVRIDTIQVQEVAMDDGEILVTRTVPAS